MSTLFTRNGDTVTVSFVTTKDASSLLKQATLSGSGKVLVQNVGQAPVFVSTSGTDLAKGIPVMPYEPTIIPYAATLYVYSPHTDALVYLTPGTNA